MSIKVCFGKYKGKSIKDMMSDEKYTEWFKSNLDFKLKYPKEWSYIEQRSIKKLSASEHKQMIIVALDDHQIDTLISDAIPNRKYFCLDCKGEVLPKRGKIKKHHYAHKNKTQCEGNSESIQHKTAKYLIHKYFHNMSITQCCIGCNNKKKFEFSDVLHSSEEYSYKKYRIDVALLSDNDVLNYAIEVEHTHKTENNKFYDILMSDTKLLEMTTNEILKYSDEILKKQSVDLNANSVNICKNCKNFGNIKRLYDIDPNLFNGNNDKHLAKSILNQWFYDQGKKGKFGKLSWQANRDCDIFLDYPMVLDKFSEFELLKAFDQLDVYVESTGVEDSQIIDSSVNWDEIFLPNVRQLLEIRSTQYDQGQLEYIISQYKKKNELEFDGWVPTSDMLKKNNINVLYKLDIAIPHKGHIVYGIVIHDGHIDSDTLIKKVREHCFDFPGIEFFSVSVNWILDNMGRIPSSLLIRPIKNYF